MPSPLLYEGVIYSVRDAGILSSIDAATGEILKQARLPRAMGAYRASPVAADGKLFFLDMDGTLTVVKAGGEWEVLHSLALDEGGADAARPRRSPTVVSTYALTRTSTASERLAGRLDRKPQSPRCNGRRSWSNTPTRAVTGNVKSMTPRRRCP